MQLDVRPDHLKIVKDILQKVVPDRIVWAFGSRVTWTAKDTSDLDLAIMGDTPLGFEVLAQLRNEFSESNIPYKVDVVDWNGISPSFKEIVKKEYLEISFIDKNLGKTKDSCKWREEQIKSVCSGIFDGPQATPKKTSCGPVFLGISSLKQGRLDLSNLEHLSEEAFKKWTRRVTPQEGDVVFSYETRIGEAAIIPKGLRCCLGRRMALMRPNKEKIVPRFLLYSFLGKDFQEVIQTRKVTGSTVERILLTEFPQFPIRIPSLDEQNQISGVLGSLDDKIELNRKMNETLEGIAKAIFKSWFVDFDPVKAKAEGRQPYGMDAGTAALFPDSFVDSELGKIPKGWEARKFSEMVEVIGGGTPKTSVNDYWNGDILWFSVVDAPSEHDVFVIETEKRISKLGLENSSTKILPIGTTIISARGTVGRLALVGKEMAMNQSCYGSRGKTFEGDFFVFFSTKNLIEELRQNTHGSVFDTITRDTLKTITAIFPQAKVVSRFEEEIAPFLKRVLSNLHESAYLKELRDKLLPKLISGEIRVGEAEKPMGEGK